MEIISRKEAKERDLKYYFTGKKCKHGHVSKRQVSDGCCYECKLIFGRKNPRNSPERKKYMREYLKDYNPPNPKEYQRKYYENNRDKELARSKSKRENNKDYYRAKIVERRAKQKNATPPWFESERKKINLVYKKASELGLEVDHVVPLTSDLVCGLHCWDNLQLLNRQENAKKLNKYWPDMPEDLG